jgi:hypothetical protein
LFLETEPLLHERICRVLNRVISRLRERFAEEVDRLVDVLLNL